MPDAGAVYRDALSPVRLLERTLRVFPEKDAVVYGDLRWSYRRFAHEVGRLAGALQRAGAAPGDRVAFLAPNVPELLVAHFAVLRIGAALVAINTRLHAEEVGYILDHSGARFVFCDPALAPQILEAPPLAARPTFVNVEDPVAGVTGRPLDGPSYAEFVAGAEALPIGFELDDEERVTSINYTSGTTGRPKGVMYTHRGAFVNALGEMYVHGLGRDSVFLWTLPMFHCNGWCFPWAVTGAGGTHVMLRTIDPARDPAPDPRRGGQPPERRADPAADAGRGPRGAGRALRPAAARRDRRLAALAHAARAHGRARHARHPPLRTHGDLRSRTSTARCSATGRGSTPRAARA